MTIYSASTVRCDTTRFSLFQSSLLSKVCEVREINTLERMFPPYKSNEIYEYGTSTDYIVEEF